MRSKRFLSMFVLLMAVMTLLSFGKSAMQTEAAEVILSGTCGTSATWQFDTDGTLTIDGTGYIDITSKPWSVVFQQIKKIVVNEGITMIRKSAFSGCTNVEEIVLPFVGYTTDAYDEQKVFGYIFGYVSFSDTNYSDPANIPVEKGGGILQEYDPNYASYTTYHYFIPKSLRKVTITNDKSIPINAFWNCDFLTEINISNVTKSIQEDAFKNCRGISAFELSDSVTSIATNAFKGCSNLREVYYKGTRNSFVGTSGIGVFDGKVQHFNDNGTCGDNATWEITYEDELLIDGEGAISSSGYFTYFDIIENVKIGKNITDFSNTKFYYLSKNTSFEVDTENPIYKSENGVIYSKDGKTLVAVPAGLAGSFSISEGVETIAESAFENCTAITELTIPESVTKIEANAFKDCGALTRVFFGGTKEQWENITVGAGCEALSGAAVTFGKYTVDYDLNAGTGSFDRQIKIYTQDLHLHNEIPVKEGYTFKGWSTSVNGEAAYAAGDSYTTDEDIVLYAVWEINTYTVSYNMNGGEGDVEAQTKTHGTDLILRDAVPKRAGHTFQGWVASQNGEATYAPGDLYSEEGNTILYAVWQEMETDITITETDAATICVDVAAWDSTVIVAWYQKGELLDVLFENVTVPVKMDLKKSNADEIKVFVWQGNTNLKPVCKSEKIEIASNQ